MVCKRTLIDSLDEDQACFVTSTSTRLAQTRPDVTVGWFKDGLPLQPEGACPLKANDDLEGHDLLTLGTKRERERERERKYA